MRSQICIKCNSKYASFNFSGEKPMFCKQCSTDDMINVKKKLCVTCNKKQPNFNLLGKRAMFCKQCSTNDMVNVNGKKCTKCKKKEPNFNLPGERPKFCKKCSTDNMINVKAKKCIKCNKAQPNFNLPGEQPRFCKKCSTNDMVNVRSKMCVKCKKTCAYFNLPGQKALFCKQCSTKDMVDITSPKCITCNKKRPLYNLPGKKALFCRGCSGLSMTNVHNKKCIGQSGKCEQWVGSRKYGKYCAFCFVNTFPDNLKSKKAYIKSKELKVRHFINEHFDGFIHDKPLIIDHCDCTIRRRPDHYKLINNTMLCIETDENQHKSYDEMDKETRYNDLFMAHSGKWVYIRFNPDSYNITVDNKLTRRNPLIKTRLDVLKQEIKKQIKRINNEENKNPVDIVYMYYDES